MESTNLRAGEDGNPQKGLGASGQEDLCLQSPSRILPGDIFTESPLPTWGVMATGQVKLERPSASTSKFLQHQSSTEHLFPWLPAHVSRMSPGKSSAERKPMDWDCPLSVGIWKPKGRVSLWTSATDGSTDGCQKPKPAQMRPPYKEEFTVAHSLNVKSVHKNARNEDHP